jgi:type II secretory pathway pseudopilin PulG
VSHRRGATGFTLLEVLITATVIGSTLVLIAESISSLSQARTMLRLQTEVAQVGNEVVRGIERDVELATRIFSNTAGDMEWLRALAIGQTVLASGARLPTLTSTGLFDTDPASTPQTGNIAFVATRETDVGVELPSGPDTLRFACYRLSVYTLVQTASGLDLLHWVSAPLLPYWDIQAIADPQVREDVVTEFHDLGFRYAWDAVAPRETGLYRLQQAGSMIAMSTSETLPGSEHEVSSRPFARRGMRVAANGSLEHVRIPEFAIANGSFPGGFEIKVDGTASGCLVLVRMVVESNLQLRRRVHGEVRRVISTNG